MGKIRILNRRRETGQGVELEVELDYGPNESLKQLGVWIPYTQTNQIIEELKKLYEVNRPTKKVINLPKEIPI